MASFLPGHGTFATAMRSLLFLLLSAAFAHARAQPVPDSMERLPAWMLERLSLPVPAKPYKPAGPALHKNAFTGTWVMRCPGGKRIEYWGDADRMIFREMRDTALLRATLVDLTANVRISVSGDRGAEVTVADLYIPQSGYFLTLWSEKVTDTGRTDTVMGVRCTERIGVDDNRDTTVYWHTDAQPKLFADLDAWAAWLCRDGQLEYLSAFNDPKAGPALRIRWHARQFEPAGEMAFVRITPGQRPMPAVQWHPDRVLEDRFAWTNSYRLGRLPAWMRERINPLPPDPRVVDRTPAAVDRGIPDNAFIGTFTAEVSRLLLGEKKDTIVRVARYTYWADARRALVRLDAPEDKGIITYLVDLDADVVVTAVDEQHNVIPKLYIDPLDRIGTTGPDRGSGPELTPTGTFNTILGHRCERYTLGSAPQPPIWISDVQQKPGPDMARWLNEGFAQHFKDLLLFDVAGKPMPFVMGRMQLTAFTLGSMVPPAIDLSTYRVNDERLGRRR